MKTLFSVIWLLLVLLPVKADDAPILERLATLEADSPAMDAVAFHPDGSILATGGRDTIIRLWDIERGELRREIAGHTDWITDLAWHPNGNLLVSGSRDDTVRVFDIETGALEIVISGHTDDVTSVDIHPDGEVIASGSRDGDILLFHLPTQSIITTLEHFGGPVWDVRFDRTGDVLASGGEDGSVWLWGVWDAAGVWIRRLSGHTGPVTSVAFSHDNRLLVTGGMDATLRLWDLEQATRLEEYETERIFYGHLAPILQVAFTIEDAVAVSASLDGSVGVWDGADGETQGTLLTTLQGNALPLTNMAVAVNGRVAAIGTSGDVFLWDAGSEAIAQLVRASRPARITPTPTRTVVQQQETNITPQNNGTVRIQVPQIQPPATSNGRLLTIPSAGIQSSVMTFPIENQTWAIDPWEPRVGHFWGTPWVTGTGNVVVGGHSEYPDGSPGIFRNLYNVGLGDEIYLSDGDTQRRYIVTNVREVDYRDLSVIYPTTHNRITLVTCDIPSYVAEQGIYYERLIVVADEVAG